MTTGIHNSRIGKAAAASSLAMLLCTAQFPAPLHAQIVGSGTGVINVAGGTTVVGSTMVAGAASVTGATVVSAGTVLAAGTVVSAGSVLNDEECGSWRVLTENAVVSSTTVLATRTVARSNRFPQPLQSESSQSTAGRDRRQASGAHRRTPDPDESTSASLR